MMAASDKHDQIARLGSPTTEDFHQEIVPRGRPIIITGAMKGWKALSSWNADYFKSAIGRREVRVQVSRTNYFPAIHGTEEPAHIKRLNKRMPFDDYADLISSENRAADRYYISQELLADKFPALVADIQRPAFIDRSLRVKNAFWFGQAGNITPLHYDLVYNLSVQVWGRKRFTLFDPAQFPLLYPFPVYSEVAQFSRVNIERPDFIRFPKFQKARPVECTLEPGEMLYTPPFWWHQVHSLNTAISLNMWWKLSWAEYLSWPALRLVCSLLLNLRQNLREISVV
jgi:[protein]-arginine 3-hydroxylase / protease